MKKSFLRALASFFIIVLIIELFLQVFGDRLPTKLNSFYINAGATYQKGQVIVLCLGDSITAWGMEKSYPAYLQQALNAAEPGKFFVINAAKLGETSQSMLESFKSELEKAKPDFVVSIIGQNDYKLTGPTKFWSRIRVISVMDHLVRVAINSLRGSFLIFSANTETEEFNVESATTWEDIEARIKQYLGAGDSLTKYHAVLRYLMDGGARSSQKAYYLAIELGNAALSKWPKDQIAADVRAVATASIPEHPQMENYLKFAYDLGTPNQLVGVYYVKQLKKSGKTEEGLRIAKELLNSEQGLTERNRQLVEQVYPELKEASMNSGTASPDVVTAENYLKLYGLLKEHQIELIVLPYPLRNVNETKKLLDGFSGIEFLDYGNFFEGSKSSYEEYFVDRSAVDFGHLKPKSAEYIGKLAAEAIIRKYNGMVARGNN